MRAAARSTSSCVAAALAAGLAGCTSDTSLALEAARAACAATLQALYDPISIDQPVSIPRVVNTSADGQKFEFIWRHDQISGLSWRMLPGDGAGRRCFTATIDDGDASSSVCACPQR
jgi:hypothetical protein